MVEAKKIILYGIILGWLSSDYSIGVNYLGSFWGDIIFFSSFLFILVFSVLNGIKAQEIENKTIDISKIKYIDVLIVSYFIIYVALYIVKSLKPPSSFLIGLFFIYFPLTIIWIWILQKKTISKVSVLLLLLALLPLIIGMISNGKENNIKNSIETLSVSKVYYEDNLDNITNGILTRDVASGIRHNIQLLKSDLDDAESDYLSGDLTGSEEKIENAKKTDIRLKEYFKLLDPQRAIFDMLQIRDKTINRLDSEVRNILVKAEARNLSVKSSVNSEVQYVSFESYNPECQEFELEQIMVDINLTRSKLNDSWSEYRKGEFQVSYNIIKDADKNITDIDKQIHTCSLSYYSNGLPPIIVLFLIVIVSILSKRIKKRRRL